MVKCLAQGHKCRDRPGRDSNPHSDNIRKRELPYYTFPKEDFQRFFAVPILPDSARDKLTSDGAATSSKGLFTDRNRGKIEEILKKIDSASRFGMRSSSLLLLSEYIVSGCEEESSIPADMLTAAFHCLDHGLRTSTRRANVLDALYIPPIGRGSKSHRLPTTDGIRLICWLIPGIHGGRSKTPIDKINYRNPAPAPRPSAGKRGKTTFQIKTNRGSFRGGRPAIPSQARAAPDCRRPRPGSQSF